MSDLIDRQILKADLLCGDNAEHDFCFPCKKILERIDNQPAVQPEQRWIPVTERLPEKECFALVTVNDGAIYTDFSLFRKDGRFIEHTGDVVAWMPLPEPYWEGKE